MFVSVRQRLKGIVLRVRDTCEIRRTQVENSHYVQHHGNIYKQVIFLIFDEPIIEPVLVVSSELRACVGLLNVKMTLHRFLESFRPLLKLMTILIPFITFSKCRWTEHIVTVV